MGRVLAAAAVIIGLAGIIFGLLHAPGVFAPYVAPIALAMVLAWAAYWRPSVTVTPAGVELCNVTRTVELPWPTIRGIETHYALTLQTAYGNYSAWAAPSAGRAGAASVDREQRARAIAEEAIRLNDESAATATSPVGPVGQAERVGLSGVAASASGSAAALVQQRWQELRDAGFLDDARLERDRPTIRWHTATLVAIAVLALASIAVPLLV